MFFSLFDKSFALRKPYLSQETNALRIFNGKSDGLDGVFIDKLDTYYLISSYKPTLPHPVSQWIQSLPNSLGIYHKWLSPKEKSASPHHLQGKKAPQDFTVYENNIAYHMSFESGYSQGLFLDQRTNRQKVSQWVKKMASPSQSPRILNCFAYTGGFSLAAAKSGAITTTLDLSAHYLKWAKNNFASNHLHPNRHFFCKGDALEWLERFAKSKRLFNGIILDPPTFARSKKKNFRVQRDYGELAQYAAHALIPNNSWILCCANTHTLSLHHFKKMLSSALPHAHITHLAMPPEYPGSNYLKTILLSF